MIIFGKGNHFLADNGKKTPLLLEIPQLFAAKGHSVPQTNPFR